MSQSQLATQPIDLADGSASDYGDFDLDLDEIEQLLTQVESQQQNNNVASLLVTDIEDYEPPEGILLPRILGFEAPKIRPKADRNSQVSRHVQAPSADSTRRSKSPESQPDSKTSDIRVEDASPLQRFRTPPKKALSVTDLVSPAWCELQYFYTLSKHGRKRRTPAMRQGSAVHQALEEEIHITVPVETTKLEDSWGLRVWNICQGLRTLRETGRTRELEIWGTVGGELVNGIIDELSYECPDPKHEEKADPSTEPDLPEYQKTITEYLLQRPAPDTTTLPPRLPRKPMSDQKQIYITDTKTRATATLPTGSSLRPTILQLHLYHHLIENLAQGNFALHLLAQRYNLNVNETFSDSFLAQLGNLNHELYKDFARQDEHSGSSGVASSQDSMDILLQHNTLDTLWAFMMQQFRITFLLDNIPSQAQVTPSAEEPALSQVSTSDLPSPPPQPTRLSTLLTAQYISSKHRTLLGRKSFHFNPAFLKAYLEDNLAWWRGQRPARGVEMQEAWKCRSCDFRTDCEWLHERNNTALKEALKRKKMREVAGVEGGGMSKSVV